MIGLLSNIYEFSMLWLVGPGIGLALVSYTGGGMVKRSRKKRLDRRAVPTKYISDTGLNKMISVGGITKGGYREPKITVSVDVRTTLDDTLSRVVSRKSEGITLKIFNIPVSTTDRYGNSRESLTEFEMKLTPAENEELQRVLCHATLEEEAIH